MEKSVCVEIQKKCSILYISFANLFFTVCVFNVDDNSIIKLITIL